MPSSTYILHHFILPFEISIQSIYTKSTFLSFLLLQPRNCRSEYFYITPQDILHYDPGLDTLYRVDLYAIFLVP